MHSQKKSKLPIGLDQHVFQSHFVVGHPYVGYLQGLERAITHFAGRNAARFTLSVHALCTENALHSILHYHAQLDNSPHLCLRVESQRSV